MQPPPAQAESTRIRLTFLTLLVVSLFILLFARLWFLQVMAGERYASLAQGNAIRTVEIEAPRGKILDRNGVPIVQNRYANVVSVQPSEMGDRQDEVLADLSDLLAIPVATLQERIDQSRVSPLRAKPVAVDVPGDIRDYIHENAATRFPGVYAETIPLRDYPGGSLAAHVVGYLGEISPEELALPEFEAYRPGDLVGWSGVERIYEQVLRGDEGVRRFEVNARGRVLRTIEDSLPTSGADLVLTLDAAAQQLLEEALDEGVRVARTVDDVGEGPGRGGKYKAPAAAAVVLDPRNGEVLAMASYPAFEPERFVGGVSHEYWGYLQDPESAFPLINRVIQSSYPPGSVFKVVSAGAALEEGYMSMGSTLPCPGRWEFGGNVFRNWKRTDSGHMNVAQALVDSCDTVFYELARRMWLDEQAQDERGEEIHERLSTAAEAWGFGRRLGIDLPGERSGVVPGRMWKRRYWERHRDNYCTQATQAEPDSYPQKLYQELCDMGYRWRGGDAVNMSIGQGDLQTTPLQVASAFAAIANRGTIYKPHVAREIRHTDGTIETISSEAIGTLPVRQEFLDYIHAGLRGVTQEGGTAGSVFGSFTSVSVAGKTGTAEDKPRQPLAWFAAYAPAEDPRYVVVTMIEQGGSGSQTAAPVVRRILQGLFGLEQTAIQAGVPTD